MSNNPNSSSTHPGQHTSATTTGMRPGDDENARTPQLQDPGDNVLELGKQMVPANPDRGPVDSINGGLTTGYQVRPIVVKDVDSTVITGSHKSSSDDVSRSVNMDAFKNQSGPRGRVPVSSISSREPAAAPPTVTVGEVVGD